MGSFRAGNVYRSSVHRNHHRFIRTFDIKRSAAGLPAVGLLVLVSVDDLLLEEAVLVINAVAEARHPERRERFEEAGGETAEAAVAESGVELGVEHFVKVYAFLF